MNPKTFLKKLSEHIDKLENDGEDIRGVKVIVNSRPGGNVVRKIIYDHINKELKLE